MITWTTAGESHGQALLALAEGFPAGVALQSADVAYELERRRRGYGRGARQKFEQDALTILSGVRHGSTLGSPMAFLIGNSEWPKWETVMSADPVPPEALLIDAGTGDAREVARNKPLTRPRPGHADLTGMNKYGFDDARPVFERASARETAARVALGCAAKALLRQWAGIEIVSRVVSVGDVDAAPSPLPLPSDAEALDASPVRCLDPASEAAMIAEIDAAHGEGDTLGGVIEVVAYGVPAGLGSYTTMMGRLDAQLAGAFMSIQAVKGVEIGDGFATARRRGSRAHDPLYPSDNPERAIERQTNRAGGIEGGMSNGEAIVVRAALKPISTVPHALPSVDTATGEASVGLHQRSDTTAVVPAAVIGEAMMAMVLASAATDVFGGDSLQAMRANLEAHLASIPETRRV